MSLLFYGRMIRRQGRIRSIQAAPYSRVTIRLCSVLVEAHGANLVEGLEIQGGKIARKPYLGRSIVSCIGRRRLSSRSVPVGGQGVQGCAPIPGASGERNRASPQADGKLGDEMGCGRRGFVYFATGISVSRKSKREATAAAMKDCQQAGGRSCKLRVAYYNQCVAIADPTIASRQRTTGNAESRHVAAETLELATAGAMKDCTAFGAGQECSIVYSACGMSEFKSFL
ncbi:DUF4189 domain-containing protein [Stenotrophomonas sp. PD6]|uniref:DUF4189 domain-containing protein n=1 Tax=Stenotrophomonas sp. PD6 TaxID=3368612 RepID=UPI003BA27114